MRITVVIITTESLLVIDLIIILDWCSRGRYPQVIMEGCLQRFCQQCGRFHPLSAFEGLRKSCRDQLDKHNARRRRRNMIEQQQKMVMKQGGP